MFTNHSSIGLLVVSLLAGQVYVQSAFSQRPSLRGSGQRSASAQQNENGTSKSGAGKFSVKSYSPRGPVPLGAVISLTFDADVITSDALDTGKVPTKIFSFEPNIEGAVQWESPRQVRFVPTKALRQGTEYIVRVNPQLKSSGGGSLTDAPEYRFQTPALSFKSAEQYQFSEDNRVSLKLTFSDMVNPADLTKHLSLKSGGGAIAWRPISQSATVAPIITTDPLTTDTLKIAIEPGLTGASGPLGLRSRIEQNVKLDFKLVATQLTGKWTKGEPSLNLKFSSFPSIADAEKYVTVEPAVKVSFSSGGSNSLQIRGPFEAEKRYTVRVKKGFRGYNSKVLLDDVTLTAWIPQMTPFLEMQNVGGYLGTKGSMKFRVRSAAIHTLIVKAHRVFDTNLPHQLEHDDWYGVTQYGKKVVEKSYPISVQANAALDTEIDLRALLGDKASGVYGLEVTGETSSTVTESGGGNDDEGYYYGNDGYRQRAVVNLSNLGLVAKKSPQEVTVFVAALDTAQPLAGIHVQVYSNRFQLMGEGDTDASGMLTIANLIENDPDAEPQMIVAHNADKSEVSLLNLNESLSGLSTFDTSGRDYLRQGYEAFITPERGAYRPGETVHLSGLIRGRGAEPPGSAFPIAVHLKRPDGKRMTPQVVTPNESGLFTLDVSVPPYAPTGYYNVEARMPGAPIEEEDDEY